MTRTDTYRYIFFLVGIISFVHGQNSPQIDLTNREFKNAPFDVRFNVDAFSTEFDEIHFCYDIAPEYLFKKKYYFRGDKLILNIDAAQKKAFFPNKIGPLHPEVPYTIEILGKKKITLSSTELNTFRASIYALVEKHLSDITQTGQKETRDFKKELLALLRSTSKADKIYDENGNEINFEGPLFKEDIYVQTINEFININNSLEKNKYNIKGYERIIRDSLENLSDVVLKLDKLLKKTRLPSTKFETLLRNPVNCELQCNSKITLWELLQLLQKDFGTTVNNIVLGKGKILGNRLWASNVRDEESLLLIRALFEKLGRESNNRTNGKPFFEESEREKIQLLHRFTGFLIDEIEVRKGNLSKREQLKNNIPNLLKDKFSQEKIQFRDEITLDIFAEKNPYIGLDLGIMFAFDINGIFSFQGANFYLKPINREAPFGNFDENKWDKYFYKRFSIYVGLAQLLTEREDNFDDLFASNSLVVGFGYRLTRTLRVNLGGLLYNEVNPSPLIDSRELRVAPTFSLSVDIDLAEALGAVGTAFNF